MNSSTSSISAYNTALSLLDKKALSCQELKLQLLSAGYDHTAINSALRQTQEYGFTNDESIGLHLLKESSRKHRGIHWLRAKLKKRLLNQTLIESVIAQAEKTILTTATLALKKKFGVKKSQIVPQKAYSFLINRGFSETTALDAIELLHS